MSDEPRWRTCCNTHEGTDHLTECEGSLFPDGFPLMPHCDQSVLHAPGECQFCDMHPEWQRYRIVARINFTGQEIEGLAPCPSEFFRPGETRDRWPGNVAAPEGEPVPSYWPPELLEAINMPGQGSYQLNREQVEDALRQAGVPEDQIRSDYGTDEDQSAYRAAIAKAQDATREAGYAAWYRGPANLGDHGWVDRVELKPPVYPWYVRFYARLRWLAAKLPK